MGRGFARHIPGILLSVALLVLVGIFAALIVSTELLPTKFVLIICLILMVFVAWILFLLWEPHRPVRLVLGVLFTLILMAVVGFGSSYISKGVDTLDEITEVTVEVADVGVYVKSEDAAQSINDAQNYVFGILSDRDRDNTDKAVREIESTLGKSLELREYAALESMMDGLLTGGEVQAVIINSAFIPLLSEMEAYQDISGKLREIHAQQVETVIEHVVKKSDVVGEDDGEAEKNTDVFSVYISGIDSRSGLIAKSRSDVNIIATVNTKTKQVLLVSTPRDYFVPLTISGGICDKLTHAGIYGVDVSIGTMEMLYDIDLDYYFRVNFSGFEGIIDALGGITVNSPVAFTSGNVTIYEGENDLDGAAALTFARERKSLAGGDRQRGENQMLIIKAAIAKALSPAILTRYSAILEQVSGNFETSISYDTIADLVRQQLDEGGGWNIVTYSVNGTDSNDVPYSLSTSAYVMVPDYTTVDHAKALMEKVRSGEILEQE